ncbi:MAG: radical SAM protein [Myxococcota bacterium]|jgi:radical SAM protein with 4Fe4S-binding SPASM domain|nr:radical SAM protein [Myxococcota bacterium]
MSLRDLWRRRGDAENDGGGLPVDLGPDQTHPIDLLWVDELVAGFRPFVVVRPEDELLILVPNRPWKMNATALRVLSAMLDEGVGIAEVLRREGDSPRKRRELHHFFADLQDLLRGQLGEGTGRRAVVHEPFDPAFCRYPVLSELALTYRCNLSCRFCYAGCRAEGLPAGWDEDRRLDLDGMKRALDIIRRDARCPSVSLTGGEPTLAPELPEVVAHGKSLGMHVNLISNGLRLGAALVDRLASAGLDSAQLSLEGPDAATHDTLVGRPGAFDRLWGALDRLRVADIRVHTNTTISRGNLAAMGAIVDGVADRGLDRLTMNLVIPCGAASGEPEAMVPYAEIGPSLLAAQERAEARGVRFIWYSPLPLCLINTAAEGLGSPGCAAADGLLHVNPAGDVLPCSSFCHDETLGNLLAESFDELWQSATARFFRDKRMLPGPCEGCDQAHICQGACTLYWREVGTAELVGGSADDRPPAPAGWFSASGDD